MRPNKNEVFCSAAPWDLERPPEDEWVLEALDVAACPQLAAVLDIYLPLGVVQSSLERLRSRGLVFRFGTTWGATWVQGI